MLLALLGCQEKPYNVSASISFLQWFIISLEFQLLPVYFSLGAFIFSLGWLIFYKFITKIQIQFYIINITKLLNQARKFYRLLLQWLYLQFPLLLVRSFWKILSKYNFLCNNCDQHPLLNLWHFNYSFNLGNQRKQPSLPQNFADTARKNYLRLKFSYTEGWITSWIWKLLSQLNRHRLVHTQLCKLMSPILALIRRSANNWVLVYFLPVFRTCKAKILPTKKHHKGLNNLFSHCVGKRSQDTINFFSFLSTDGHIDSLSVNI